MDFVSFLSVTFRNSLFFLDFVQLYILSVIGRIDCVHLSASSTHRTPLHQNPFVVHQFVRGHPNTSTLLLRLIVFDSVLFFPTNKFFF